MIIRRSTANASRKNRERLFVGSPSTIVRARLGELIEETQADEAMITTMIYDHEARKRSYTLLAEAFSLAAPHARPHAQQCAVIRKFREMILGKHFLAHHQRQPYAWRLSRRSRPASRKARWWSRRRFSASTAISAMSATASRRKVMSRSRPPCSTASCAISSPAIRPTRSRMRAPTSPRSTGRKCCSTSRPASTT